MLEKNEGGRGQKKTTKKGKGMHKLLCWCTLKMFDVVILCRYPIWRSNFADHLVEFYQEEGQWQQLSPRPRRFGFVWWTRVQRWNGEPHRCRSGMHSSAAACYCLIYADVRWIFHPLRLFPPYPTGRKGEVVYIPDNWGHAIMNLEPSVGVSKQIGTFRYPLGVPDSVAKLLWRNCKNILL